jgi:hypothetical protein
MFTRLRTSILAFLALGVSVAFATNTLYPYTGTGTTGMRVTQDPGNTNQALGNQILCDQVGTNCSTVNAGGELFVAPFTSPTITSPTATLTLPTRTVASSANSVTAASPCVFTWTATPAVNGQSVLLTGTTAPGTGAFVNGTTYWVTAKATNTVELAATSGGAALNCPTTAGVAEVLTLNYAPSTLIGNSATAGSVTSSPFVIATSGGAAVAPYIQLLTSATSGWNGVTVSINLWKAQPTYTNGDDQLYVVATGAANYIATLSGTLTQFGDGAVANFYPSPQVAALLQPSTAANIYWDLQMIGTAIPVSAQTFTIKPGLIN